MCCHHISYLSPPWPLTFPHPNTDRTRYDGNQNGHASVTIRRKISEKISFYSSCLVSCCSDFDIAGQSTKGRRGNDSKVSSFMPKKNTFLRCESCKLSNMAKQTNLKARIWNFIIKWKRTFPPWQEENCLKFSSFKGEGMFWLNFKYSLRVPIILFFFSPHIKGICCIWYIPSPPLSLYLKFFRKWFQPRKQPSVKVRKCVHRTWRLTNLILRMKLVNQYR